MSENNLSLQEQEYYARQLSLKEFGLKGQKKLKETSVLLIGVGGVGCPVAIYLVGLGIGRLTIIDDDVVNISNLHRQVLFDIDSISKSKAIVAKQKLEKSNPYVQIEAITERLTLSNYDFLMMNDYDFIIDTSDNFETKTLSNKLSLVYEIPLIVGGVSNFSYQAGIFNINRDQACLSCLYPDLTQKSHSKELGVIGLIAAQAGLAFVNILLNFLLDNHKFMGSVLYNYNLVKMSIDKYEIDKNLDCEVCSC